MIHTIEKEITKPAYYFRANNTDILAIFLCELEQFIKSIIYYCTKDKLQVQRFKTTAISEYPLFSSFV